MGSRATQRFSQRTCWRIGYGEDDKKGIKGQSIWWMVANFLKGEDGWVEMGRNEALSLGHVRYEMPLDTQLEMSKRSLRMRV